MGASKRCEWLRSQGAKGDSLAELEYDYYREGDTSGLSLADYKHRFYSKHAGRSCDSVSDLEYEYLSKTLGCGGSLADLRDKQCSRRILRTNLVTSVRLGSTGQSVLSGEGPKTQVVCTITGSNQMRLADIFACFSQKGPVTFSVDVENAESISRPIEFALRTDVADNGSTKAASVSIPPGKSRQSVTFDANFATAPTVRGGVSIINRTSIVGAKLIFSNFSVENMDVAGPFFDGDTKPILRTNLNLYPFTSSSTSASPSTGVWQNGASHKSVTLPDGGSRSTVVVAGTGAVYLPRKNVASAFCVSLRGKRATFVTRLRSSVSGVASAPGNVSNYRAIGDTADKTMPTAMFVAKSHSGSVDILANEIITQWWTLDVPVDAFQFNPTTFYTQWAIKADDWFDLLDCDIYEGNYDPAREFVAPGHYDSKGMYCMWSGPENASPSIVVDPNQTVEWLGEKNNSPSVLIGY